jgi:hypothetical protein
MPPGTVGGVGFWIPPGASLFGVRSLSLVLSDFGTLLFCLFLLLIFYTLFLVLFIGEVITSLFWMIRIRAKV